MKSPVLVALFAATALVSGLARLPLASASEPESVAPVPSAPVGAGAAMQGETTPSAGAGANAAVGRKLAEMLGALPPPPTLILHDRVLSLAGIESFDGGPDAPEADLAVWRQLRSEIARSAAGPERFPDLDAIREELSQEIRRGVVPILVLDVAYDRLRPDALAKGAVVAQGSRLVANQGTEVRSIYETRRVHVAAPLVASTIRGGAVRFRLDRAAYLSDGASPGSGWPRVEADFDDGRSWRRVPFDEDVEVAYTHAGRRTIRLRVTGADGLVRHSAFGFEVVALRAPSPHDTLHVTASIPYLGVHGTGEAYVYLSDRNTNLTEPVVLIEGFDPDNVRNWDELYTLLNREELVERMRQDGFDLVVLNFTAGADYIQRNGYVVVELLNQVRAQVGTSTTMAVVGASMGGLCGRYALAYMESQGISHSARTFVSFDSPQRGADIPLGLQYWIWFFAEQSSEAEAFLADLNSPAARQMLLYHYTDPPTGSGQPDALRGQLLAELANLGQYPQSPRLVSVANGSGHGLNQGFNPGAQIIRWEYTSFLLDITGNVWAVPDLTNTRIFYGLIDPFLLPADEVSVSVAATRPYDGAPGGWSDSMALLAASDPGYGDIVALHSNHCFIPVTSALDLETSDPFYDIDGDPDLLDHTPFDAVYYPTLNQPHVEVTAQNAAWFLEEIERGATAVQPLSAGVVGARVEIAGSNPTAGPTRLRLSAPRAGEAVLRIVDVAGREVARPYGGPLAAGVSEIGWEAVSGDGRPLSAGVYLAVLRGPGYAASTKLVLR